MAEHAASRGSGAGRQKVGGQERLRRIVAAARYAVPRYARALMDSVREHGEGDLNTAGMRGDVLSDVVAGGLGAVWIGHATVLIRLGGLTILTDPVFSSRIGMKVGGVTFGVRRVCEPAAGVEHLPLIDVVLLSHAHFDHLDRPSLAALAAGPARRATVITAMHTRRLIPEGFARVIELPWERRARIGAAWANTEAIAPGVRVRAVRPAHWGARAAVDRHRRFNSYVLESAGGERVFFAGDSAHTDAFDALGPMDLSIFGIGAYDPWEGAHATPEQVWRMYTAMQSGAVRRGVLLPMHHSTFVLGREPLHEPMARLRAAAGERGAGALAAVRPGDHWIGPVCARCA